VAAVATAALGLLLPAGPAEAESPSRVAEETADDGVFVGIGRGDDVDEAALMAAVENASFDGLRIVVVVPQDPQPTAKAFARRVQEQTEADAVLVFPEEGPLESYMADELSSSRIRATEAARSLVDPARAVSAFAEEVNSVGETGTPRIIRQVINALLLMALVIGVVIGIEILVDRMRRPAPNAG
jgi:hypothetical protein